MSLRFSTLKPGARLPLLGVLLEVQKSSSRDAGQEPSCGKCYFMKNHCGSIGCATVDCFPNEYRKEYIEFVEIEKGGKNGK